MMGSSSELQESIIVDGSKLLTDGSLEVRQHAKHLWAEVVQHSRTDSLLKENLKDPELRDVKKILDNLS